MNMFIKRLVIFLIRRRLKLKKYEKFVFTNQKTESVYWFTTTKLLKKENGVITRAHVSLNWLLNEACVVQSANIKIY